jgi:ATP-dependent DNA helicase RecG
MKESLVELINKGESQNLEFKSSFGEEAMISVVALSNAKGGKVILGVDNNSNIKGITIGKESVNQWINEIKSKTEPQLIPDIDVYVIENKTIAVISIYENPIKPVSIKGKYYKRISNSNHQLTVNEIANLHLP